MFIPDVQFQTPSNDTEYLFIWKENLRFREFKVPKSSSICAYAFGYHNTIQIYISDEQYMSVIGHVIRTIEFAVRSNEL